jgi:hypothetical protein
MHIHYNPGPKKKAPPPPRRVPPHEDPSAPTALAQSSAAQARRMAVNFAKLPGLLRREG